MDLILNNSSISILPTKKRIYLPTVNILSTFYLFSFLWYYCVWVSFDLYYYFIFCTVVNRHKTIFLFWCGIWFYFEWFQRIRSLWESIDLTSNTLLIQNKKTRVKYMSFDEIRFSIKFHIFIRNNTINLVQIRKQFAPLQVLILRLLN